MELSGITRPPCLACGGPLSAIMECKACGLPHVVPQPGPQQRYMGSRAGITVMGGARGGGKTHGTFMRPLFVDNGLPLGALDDPRFTGTFFRSEATSIRKPGGLWDKAKKFYRPLGATPNERDLVLRFPSGAAILFSGLDDVDKHRGNEYLWIACEEATQLDWSDFLALMRCNRPSGGCQIQPWIDLTCNPDPDSWVFRLISWWIWPESHELAGFPRADRLDQLRYFTIDGEEIVWIDEVYDGAPEDWRDDDGVPATSVAFIPSTVDDNPALNETDPTYRSRLNSQRHVERMKERFGNWLASDRTGIFARAYVRWIEPADAPTGMRQLRYWDLAATDRHGREELRNATAGVLAGLHTCRTCSGWRYVDEADPCPECNVNAATGSPFVHPWQVPAPQQIMVVVDVQFGELGPGDVEALIRETALGDGVAVPVYYEEEAAASGKLTTHSLTQKILPEFNVFGDQPRGAKEARARNVAALAEHGLLWVVRDIRTQKLINQALRDFPKAGRDIIDAMSGAERCHRVHDWRADAWLI